MKAAHLASGGAAVAGLVETVRAVNGEHTLLGLPLLAWPAAALLFVGAVAAAASVRPWGRRLPAGLITLGLWLVAAASLAGSCFVLLNLIELVVTGTVTDRDGNDDWSTFIERLFAAGLAVLFVAAAMSWRGRISGRCTRCGETHPTDAVELVHPVPHAAPRGVRWTAYAGCLKRVPRFLPLSPVFLVAPTLALYGVGSVPYAIASGQADQLWGLGGTASLAFGGYGCALLVAAVSYRRRTRPRCASATGRPEKVQVPLASGPLG